MNKFAKVASGSLLAMQLVMPLLVLAAPAGLPDPGAPTTNINSLCGVIDLIKTISNWMIFFLITLAVIFVIMAAFKYLTAGGDAEKVSKANSQIIYAAVAVAVGLLAYAVPAIVKAFLLSGDQSCPA